MGSKGSPISTERHREAFDLYYDLRSLNQVANSTGIDQHTLRRWKNGEVACNCPYHNWDDLVAEREIAMAKRMELLDEGVVDPLAHEQAMLDLDPTQVLPEAVKEAVRPMGRVLQRNELERIAHFEFLYAKLFFHATGCVIDHGTLLDMAGAAFDIDRCREYFEKKGLEPRSLEQCIKALLQITDKIGELREELGLRKARPTVTSTPAPVIQPPTKDAASLTGPPALALDDLRKIKERMESLSPEEVRAVTEAFNQQEASKMTIEAPR